MTTFFYILSANEEALILFSPFEGESKRYRTDTYLGSYAIEGRKRDEHGNLVDEGMIFYDSKTVSVSSMTEINTKLESLEDIPKPNKD